MRSALRILGGLLCGVVVVWFLLGARQAHETARARAIVSSGRVPTAIEARHARAWLHSAGELNPDREVDVLRATLADERGDRARGLLIISAVLRAEPENAEAWEVYARSGTHADALRALAHLIELVHQPR